MNHPIICEITNPSDSYTIAGPRFDVLAVATLLLGDGRWGLRGDSEEHHMPLFLFTGHEPWFAAHGVPDLDAFIGAHMVEIADALDSVLIGSRAQRKAFEAAMAAIDSPTQRERARAAWHDTMRSSMNDIGGYAYELAGIIREKARGTEAPTGA